MELIKSFGFEPVLFVAQIINFVLVLYILKRFLYKPLLSMIKARQKEIKDGLYAAEEGQKLLVVAADKEKAMLKKAQDESRRLINDANKEAVAIAAEVEENARKRTEKMLMDAKQTIEEESLATEKRLMGKISTLAVEMLESSLKNFFGEKEQKEVLGKAMKQIKKIN